MLKENIIVPSLKVVFLANYIVEIVETIILVMKDGVKLEQVHIMQQLKYATLLACFELIGMEQLTINFLFYLFKLGVH